MIWPSFTKGIWSLIISKIGVFTNIDASQLELSGSSLKLSNVSIDQSKLSNELVEVNDVVIGSLLLELNSSGLNITANNVVATAALKSLLPPELAISMFLESTKNNLNSAEIDPLAQNPSSAAKNGNTVTSRLADMIMSHISMRITGITMDLSLVNDKKIRVSIEQIMMPHKERLEIESLTLTTNSENEIHLSRAIIWEKNNDLGSSNYTETATINRIVADFGFNPMRCALKFDQIRIDGLASLEIIILCLNEIVFKHAKLSAKNDKEPSMEAAELPAELSFSCCIEKIDILDAWDSLAAPLCLRGINVDSNRAKIDSMSFGAISHISPFVEVRFNKTLEVLWEVPLSIDIPLENLEYLGQVFSKAASLISKLEPPVDSEPTPMNIFLPEFRIGIGSDFTVHLFPHRITEIGVNLKEVLIIAGDGQVLISELYLDFTDGLLVDKIKANISQRFLDQVHMIIEILRPQISTGDEPDQAISPIIADKPLIWEGIDLPAMNMNFRQILIEGVNNIKVSGEVNAQYEETKVSLLAQVLVQYKDFTAEMNISSESDPKLKDVIVNLHIRMLDYKVSSDAFDRETKKEKSTSMPILLPSITINVTLDKTKLVLNEVGLLPQLSATILVANSTENMTFDFPSVTVKTQSIRESEEPVTILKVLNLFLDKKDTKLSAKVGSMALSCCADSFASLTALPGEFIKSEEVMPSLKTELDEQLDIFRDIVESEFLFTGSKFHSRRARCETQLHQLDIRDDYLSETRNTDGNTVCQSVYEAIGIITSTLASSVDVEIKRFQWQLFDGFDFEKSRQKIQDAVERVSKAAQELSAQRSPSSDSDREDDLNPAVGDFMYQSMMITTVPSQAKDLKKTVAKDLGSPSDFSRSMEPKIVLSLRKLRFTSCQAITAPNSHISVVIKDGKISDLVGTSKFKHLLWQEHKTGQNILMFTKDVTGPLYAPEIRSSLFLKPLRLSLDQDTLEFIFRFFQYSDDDVRDAVPKDTHENETANENNKKNAVPFIQRFEFGSLPLTIDYNPRKVDFKSLRSGAAAELLNIFAIRGARLTLDKSVLHGVSGWGPLFSELLDSWMPSIRAHQLGGLVSGISPVRKALKVSKGVGKYTVSPIKRTQIPKGASVVVRKTMDELLRLRTSWLDSADKALGG